MDLIAVIRFVGIEACFVFVAGAGAAGAPGARGYLSNGYFGVILTICFGWRRGYFGVRVWARHEFGYSPKETARRQSRARARVKSGSSVGRCLRIVFVKQIYKTISNY